MLDFSFVFHRTCLNFAQNMDKTKKNKRWWLWGLGIFLFPIVFFLCLSIAVYLPPVQRFLVDKATESMAEATGVEVALEKVRLSFPLDLALHGVQAKDGQDTLADVGVLLVDVRLLPLLKGRVDVEGLTLRQAKLNTRSWIPDTYIRGEIGELYAASHGIALTENWAKLDEARLRNARLFVALSDTGKVDTTASEPLLWNILAKQVELTRSEISLSLPGDSMRLGLAFGDARLADGEFDLGKGNYRVKKLELKRSGLTYAVRPVTPVAEEKRPNTAFAQSDSLLWEGFHTALPGIDPQYIALDNLALRLDTLNYGADGRLTAGLQHLSLHERSGLTLQNLSGAFYMDNDKVALRDFVLNTDETHLNCDALLEWAALVEGKAGRAQLDLRGDLSIKDLKRVANGYLEKEWMEAIPETPIALNVRVNGNADRMEVDTFRLSWPTVLVADMQGRMEQPMQEARSGELRFELRAHSLSFAHQLLPEDQMQFAIPDNFRLKGKATVKNGYYRLNALSQAGDGELKLDGGVQLDQERYQLDFQSSHFPLQRFLVNAGLSPLSARATVKGHRFDLLKPTAFLEAEASVDTFQYNKWQLGTISLKAALDKGVGNLSFASANDVLYGEGKIDAVLGKEKIEVKLRSELPGINLTNILEMKDTLQVGASFAIDAYTNRDFTAYGLGGGLQNVRFITADKGIPSKDLLFKFDTSADTTRMWTSAGDLQMRLAASDAIGDVLEHVQVFAEALQQQLAEKKLNQNALKGIMPVMDFHLQAGNDNPLANLMRDMNYTYRSMTFDLNASPEVGVVGDFRLGAFHMGHLLLDTLSVQLKQDTTGLVANGWVKNYTRRNPDKFESTLDAYLLNSGVGVELRFKDKQDRTGIHLGVRADLYPDGAKVILFPEHPVIAYRKFTVNRNNYIFLGNDSTVSADVDLLADDGTGLRIYGLPNDSVNDLTLSLNRVNLAELSEVLPYLPKLSGLLSSDFHVVDDHNTLSAAGSVEVEKLVFEGAPLGNIGMETVYMPGNANEHYAQAFLTSEGTEVMSVSGLYTADEKGGFEGTAELLDFPLDLLNGFLSGTDVAMSGKGRGTLNVKGGVGDPLINGEVSFDEAHLYSDVYGFDFRMDETPVRFKNNQMVLKNFALHSKQSNNPLVLNGNLDMRKLSDIRMDFSMRARNFELINTKKKPQSLVFGKVYANFDGSLKGSADDISVRGNLEVLDRTDMTYILKDSPLTVDDRLHDLVQFVSFTDSVEFVEEEMPMGSFNMTLGIAISDAALFHCNLSEDGQNYIDLEGGGDLTLRLTQQGDMRLTGRFTATSGEMKYSLPVIPLKTFNLEAGSYVDFKGDVMNPTLNIIAKERVRATVTENDQPRSVAFDVGVTITQPLAQMGLEFTIDAPEDLAVQNQLLSMTKAERGKVAVAMLATGMYLTEESMSSSGSGFKTSNALTAFLQSEIQNIAGNALKTIDLSIGMENNTSAVGTTTTDYSFQFAKRFWGNRISVIIGGKVSTGADAENSAESFIDNIAVEYRLDKSASRYVRVFYDRSSQDPLEGQLIKTGAGIVLRRKSDKLGDLFIFRNRKSEKKSEKKTGK